MKRQFVGMVFATIFSITAVNAQGGGGQWQMIKLAMIKIHRVTSGTR